MINKKSKFLLPLILCISLFTVLFAGCKIIIWGGELNNLNEDLTTSCYFYGDSTPGSSFITLDFIIGQTYEPPVLDKEQVKSLGKPGFHPSGWVLRDPSTADKNFSIDETGLVKTFTVSYKPYEFVPESWQASSDTPYKVQHYQEQLDSTYLLKDEEICYGLTDSQAVVTEKNYTGFAVTPYFCPDIAGDGSTVVQVYYDRLTYTIKYNMPDGSDTTFADLKYESPFPTVPDPVKTGFKFKGWSNAAKPELGVISLPVKVTSNMILDPLFLQYYKVQFNLNGGTTTTVFDSTSLDGSGNTVGEFIGTELDKLKKVAVPVKPNYQFQYWIDVSTGNPAVLPEYFEGNAEYKAYYELKTQTINGITVSFPAVSDNMEEGASSELTRTTVGTSYIFKVLKSYSSYVWTLNGVAALGTNSFEVDMTVLNSGTYELCAICYDSSGNATIYEQVFVITKDNDMGGGL